MVTGLIRYPPRNNTLLPREQEMTKRSLSDQKSVFHIYLPTFIILQKSDLIKIV